MTTPRLWRNSSAGKANKKGLGPRVGRANDRTAPDLHALELGIRQMSPEHRRARLLELQAKAGLVIEGEAEEAEEDRTGVLLSRRVDCGPS